MTDHPLTDEMCEILSRQPWLDPDVDVEGIAHDMRAAYDKGFEHAIEFIRRMGLAPHGALAEAQEAFYNKEDNNDQ